MSQPRHAPVGWDGVLAMCILIFASLDMAGWVHGLPVPLLMIRATWWLLYLGVVVRLVQRYGGDWIRWLVRRQVVLLLVLAIAVLSPLWSLAPWESLRTSLSLMATTLVGAYIGYALSPRVFASVLSVVFPVLIVSNLGALPILPDRIVVEPLTQQWRGLMDHKNSLGAMAALALLFHATPIFRRGVVSPWRIAWCGTCALALLLSRSVTSLLACGAGVAWLAWSVAGHRVRRTSRRARIVLLSSLGVALIAATFSIAPITRALGRDATLNGRTQRWAASLDIIRERLLTGYGYNAVWRKQEGSLLPHIPATTWRSSSSSHNAVLNTATELGVPAAGLLVAYLVGIFLDAARFRRRDDSSLALYVTASLLAMATLNFAESYLLAVHSVQWILCVATGVMLRRSLDAGSAAALPFPPS